MHFFSIIATALVGASTTIAMPAIKAKADTLCFGLPGSPECCATDVLGIADLDCSPPPSVPSNITSFRAMCAAEGQQAKCCVLPAAGQALVCQNPPA